MRNPVIRGAISVILTLSLLIPAIVVPSGIAQAASPAISCGDRVAVTYAGGGVAVRSSYSTSSVLIRNMGAGYEGEVIGGPQSNQGYRWWRIQWVTGDIGWTADASSGGIAYLQPLPGNGIYPNVDHGGLSYRVNVYSDVGNVNLAVRSAPGTWNDPPLVRKYAGSRGWTLADTPVITQQMVWWHILWDDGVMGWSADSQPPWGVYLVKEGSKYLPSCSVNTPSVPSGTTSGMINTSYSYSAGWSSCAAGHSVQYRFDWGDGTYSSWTSYTSALQSWSAPGIYYVRAQARCAIYTSVVSGWSSPLMVRVSTASTLSFTDLNPATVVTSDSTHYAELVANGTNFNNVNQITFTWSGPDSDTETWSRGGSIWNSRVNVISDTYMTFTPRVLYNAGGSQTLTWTWTVTMRDTTGAAKSRSFTVTYIPVDTIEPTITSMSVYPSKTAVGNPFTISFSVLDSGGSGLKQVELWRANDNGGSPGTWAQVTSRSVSGDSYSGSFSDTPSYFGSYWYGIHAVDNANNWGAEPMPVRVMVYLLQLPETWSFAVITDLHIGYGYPDYAEPGWDDGNNPSECQEYWLTERLRRVVTRIRELQAQKNIKFVAVLGDISDKGEKSQLLMARDILEGLNYDSDGDGDYDMVYVPMLGNHDVWPYTQVEGHHPDGLGIELPLGEHLLGARIAAAEADGPHHFLYSVFGEQLRILAEFFSDFEQGSGDLVNYAFNLPGSEIRFVVADFVSREGHCNLVPSMNFAGAKGSLELHDETELFIRAQLPANGRAVILSHHTFEEWWLGYVDNQCLSRDSVEGLLCRAAHMDCDLYNFGGHYHQNWDHTMRRACVSLEWPPDAWSASCTVVETSSVLKSASEAIRLVEVSGNEITNYDTRYDVTDPGLNVFFSTEGGPQAWDSTEFQGYPEGQKSYAWDFGDSLPPTIHVYYDDADAAHTYEEAGLYRLTLTVATKEDKAASISRVPVTVGEPGVDERLIRGLQEGIEAVAMESRRVVSEVGQRWDDLVMLVQHHSEAKPVAILGVRFNEAADDIDLSALTAEIDTVARKSIVHMPSWPPEIDESRILFIPSSGVGTVYICPNATSLEQVSPDDANRVIINVGETVDGMTVTTTYYNGEEYYMVSGVTGTGGGEADWIARPNLTLNATDIHFPNGIPIVGETVVINATIRNVGDVAASRASVTFYDGDPETGALIDWDTIDVPGGGTADASVVWNASAPGTHEIYVVAEVAGFPRDSNPANNIACRTIDVRLFWDKVDTPAMQGWVLVPRSTIIDYAVAAGGEVAYAIVERAEYQDRHLLRSRDSAATWEVIAPGLEEVLRPGEYITDLLKVACDTGDSDFVAIALGVYDGVGAVVGRVYISNDGGATFEDTGDIECGAVMLPAGGVFELKVSPEVLGKRDIAIGGYGSDGYGALFRCTVTADSIGVWEDATTYDGWDDDGGFTSLAVVDIHFSPSWATDKTILVATANDTAVWLQSGTWGTSAGWNNASTLAIESVLLVDASTTDIVTGWGGLRGLTAGITTPVDYSGQDADRRYVWAWVNYYDTFRGGPACVIVRVDNDCADPIEPMGQIEDGELWLTNISYHGTIAEGEAIAGVLGNGIGDLEDCGIGVQVYRNDGIRQMHICCERWHDACKPPTGVDATATFYVGDDKAYAVGLQGFEDGDEGAWSVTFDDGDTWNQLSLIDTNIDYLSDVAVSPDCNKTMLVTVNEEGSCQCDSVWLRADNLPEAEEYSGKWLRTWCGQLEGLDYDGYEHGVLRLTPEEITGDTVYLADIGSGNVYRSDLGTLACWEPIGSAVLGNIVDVAAQGADTIYALGYDGDVAMFDKGEWNTAVNSTVDQGWTIAIHGNHILVGGQTGDVSYCGDGGETFTALEDVAASGYVTVAFDTYFDTNNMIYAAVAGAGTDNGVYRWIIDQSTQWEDFRAEPYDYTGLALDRPWGNPLTSAETGGALYASYVTEAGGETVTGVARCLTPAGQLCCQINAWDYLDDGLVPDTAFSMVPSSLKICGGLTPDSNNKLFAVDSLGGYDMEMGADGAVWKFIDAPRTWYVDDDLVDYPAADFTTIQDAVDAASFRDTVIVYPGNYIENVDVKKAHLTIQSQNGAETTIVDGNYSRSVFTIHEGQTRIEGFTIRHGNLHGIWIEYGVKDNIITGNTIINNDHSGIAATGYAFGNIITENVISNSDHAGIFLGQAGRNTIQRNRISDISFFGIEITCSQDVDLCCNSIVENMISGCGDGIGIASSDSNEIYRNAFLDNNRAIDLEDSTANVIYLNSFLENIDDVYSDNSTITLNSLQPMCYAYNGTAYTSYLGNHWSDYSGSDASGDGIGDTPYPIDSDADNYPLVEPFENYEIVPAWYVDDDLVDCPAADFTSIQDAVDAASSGDTIIVYPGTYTENVDVSKDRLTIQSQSGPEATIVQAVRIDYVFGLTANYVNINGFTIGGGTQSAGAGLSIVDSNYCHIWGNNLLNNGDGIYLLSSRHNTIDNNVIAGNHRFGIFLCASTNDELVNNTFENDGIIILGDSLPDYDTHTIQGNTVNGKPIYFYKNTSNIKVPENAGEVILANCTGVSADNIDASFGSLGIELAYTADSRISKCNISNNHDGVRLLYSINNTLVNNTISNNRNNNVLLESSSENSIVDNVMSGEHVGIWLSGSGNNVIANNSISNNDYGIFLGYSASNNNVIYLNNFVGNTQSATSYPDESINTWHTSEEITYSYNGNAYTSYLGNYWDDYTGNDADGDGIGDTPYPVASDGDNYPLSELSEGYCKRWVYGIPVDFRFETELSRGADVPEVRYLQIILNMDVDTQVAAAGDGSPGNETTSFDSLTEDAVRRFQVKHGLPDTGFVCDATRAELNEKLEENFTDEFKSQFDLLDEDQRKGTIWEYITEFRDDYLPEDFPAELILAIAAQGTGEYAHWNNEHVANDWGRGVMQIISDSTTDGVYGFVGKGGVDSDSEDCLRASDRAYPKLYSSRYYSNTFKGFEANIRDGLYGLWSEYAGVSEDSIDPPVGYTRDEIVWMLTVQRYGGFRTEPSQYLWMVGDKLVRLANGEYGDFDGFDKEYARALGDKFMGVPSEEVMLHSPALLQIYDSEGNVVGLMDEVIKLEIPNSVYDTATETVLILCPSADHRYNVVGVGEGTYGLSASFFDGAESISFTATDIPTGLGVVHQYYIDWGVLEQGGDGVTVEVDSNGDGIIDYTLTAGRELTGDEFVLPAATDFDPNVFSLAAPRGAVTAYLELPAGHDVAQIDISSIRLNGAVPALGKPTKVGDYDKDGIPDLMVKFDRSAVKGVLTPGSQVEVTITGEVASIRFEGTDTIRVID